MIKKTYFLLVIVFQAMVLNAQWSDNPEVNLQITNLTGEQVLPKIAVCLDGSYYVGYFSLESGNYNVRLQRIDSDGNMLWQENGLLVSDHPSMTWITDWDMTTDLENHAVLCFMDIRNSGHNNIVAYRISPDGSFVWGNDGIMLSDDENFNAAPKLTVTNSNNVVFAWQATNNIVIQKLNPLGQKQWGEWGITFTGTVKYTWPQLIPVGSDDVIMKYFNDSGTSWAPIRHAFAQRYTTDGSAVWASPAVISNAGTIAAWTQILPMFNDGTDGFYVAWHDNRFSGTIATAWVQHVTSHGELVFAANGVEVSTQSSMNHFYPKIAKPENDSCLYVFWREVNGNQNQWGVFAQKFGPAGDRLWEDTGKEILAVSGTEVMPHLTIPNDNNVMLVTTKEANLEVALLNNGGDFVWESNFKTISNTSGAKSNIVISDFSNNQWVLAWEESRNGDQNLFAQNMHKDGSLGELINHGFISGLVSVENNLVDVTEILLIAGNSATYPDSLGNFSFEILPGTYNLVATHPFVQTDTVFNVVVGEDSLTSGISVELNVLRRNLACHVVNENGTYISGMLVTISGPEGEYTDTSDNGPIILENLPYGFYLASIVTDLGTITSDTLLDGSNGDLFLHLTVGIADQSLNMAQVSIFPNPVTAESVVKVCGSIGKYLNIKILSTTGKCISTAEVKNTDSEEIFFKLNNVLGEEKLMPGMYLIQIFDGKNLHVKRFVVR